MEDYATKKSLKVLESMMSLLPTTEMLHEATYGIEQQLQHLEKKVN